MRQLFSRRRPYCSRLQSSSFARSLFCAGLQTPFQESFHDDLTHGCFPFEYLLAQSLVHIHRHIHGEGARYIFCHCVPTYVIFCTYIHNAKNNPLKKGLRRSGASYPFTMKVRFVYPPSRHKRTVRVGKCGTGPHLATRTERLALSLPPPQIWRRSLFLGHSFSTPRLLSASFPCLLIWWIASTTLPMNAEENDPLGVLSSIT